MVMSMAVMLGATQRVLHHPPDTWSTGRSPVTGSVRPASSPGAVFTESLQSDTCHGRRRAVSDTVEFGGWPRPPRWVWAIAGAAAVAVLAGEVAAHTGPPRRAAPAAAVTSPATPGNGGLRMPPREPARMAGRPMPRSAGPRLMV